jgi:hypothetical protein
MYLALSALSVLCASNVRAQESPLEAVSTAPANLLPDAPGADWQQAPVNKTRPGPQPNDQTEPFRFRGIVSTEGLVQDGTIQPRQTTADKLVLAAEDNFNLYGVVAVGFVAGYDLALNRTPDFHAGAKGYARYYWHAYADRAVEIASVEVIAPLIFHQDTRFYYLGKGPLAHRIGHSIRRTFITRSDSGHEQFNYSEILGTGVASGISTLYYPSRERSAANTLATWGINIGVDTFGFIVQELYPSVFQAIFHRTSDPAR